MALKIYELITVSVNDGGREVETQLFNYKHELEKEFAAKVVKTLRYIEEEYGKDGLVEHDSDDILAIEAARVLYTIDWENMKFWAEEAEEPGAYEIQFWITEHEI